MSNKSLSASKVTVEHRGIDFVPEEQRYGRPLNQFSIRFSPVIYLAGIFVGSTGGAFGLGFSGSVSAIILGNILGSIATAACAQMGPRTGIPQIPVGRAAFGFHGNFVPAILQLLVCIGYYTVGVILGAKSLASLFNISYIPMIIVVALLSVVIGIYGYRLLHIFARWITYASIVVLAITTVYMITHGAGPDAASSLSGKEYLSIWMLQFTVVFGYTVSWAPYAADYSRFLPKASSSTSIFVWSGTGLMAATSWMMILGAGLISLDASGDVIEAFAIVLPDWFRYILLFALALSSIPHNAVNLYSGTMALLASNIRIKQAVIVAICGTAGGALGLFLGGSRFQDSFESYLHIISYFIMPWLAVILVFYFKVYRNGRLFPDIDELYQPDGPFKGIRWSGSGAFLAGIIVSIPFMSNDFYTGPIGHALNGADSSYFVSGIVAGVVCWIATRKANRTSAVATKLESPVSSNLD